MALVAAYGSETEGSDSEDFLNERLTARDAEPETNNEGHSEASTSQDSYFAHSDSESEDSATRRRRQAEERLTNGSEEVRGPSSSELPPPLAVISRTSQPDFLRPEATRPIAKPFHKSRAPITKAVLPTPQEQRKEYDISSMAPKLKGQSEAEKRGLPSGAVISASAKKYKPEETEHIVTAAQVAMLGGQWKPSEDVDHAVSSKQDRRPSAAMPVSDFLAKGTAGNLLPRSRQDRRDKEKEKRARGQSSVHGWKSEAEMVLRQQYD